MADVKWIKICTDIFDDEKILLIEDMPERDAIIVIWFKLLCLAGKQNNDGIFMLNDKIPYTDEMLSAIFRRPLNTIRLALKTFEAYGMVEIIDSTITIPNWQKHQQLDKLAKKREDTRKRVAAYRARNRKRIEGLKNCDEQALPSGNEDVTRYSGVTNAAVTVLDKEEDIDTDIDTEPSSSESRTPSQEEVTAFFAKEGLTIDPVRFFRINEQQGWTAKDGEPIHDWHAWARTWDQNSKKGFRETAASSTASRRAPSVEEIMKLHGVSREAAAEMLREDLY